MPSASSIRHKPSSWDCASIGNVKQRHRKDTLLLIIGHILVLLIFVQRLASSVSSFC